MTPFEQEVLEDLTHAIAEVKDSDMDKQAKIVCFAALYAFGWIVDHEPEVMKRAMAAVMVKLECPHGTS